MTASNQPEDAQTEPSGPPDAPAAPRPIPSRATETEVRVDQQAGVVGPGGTVIGFYQVVQYPAAAEPEPGECPYKGLEAYDVQDAPLFFGREALTAKLVCSLRAHPFLAVVGASGSGKSSVVRAGVVAALRAGQDLEGGVLPPLGSADWPWLIVTPTASPLEALARELASDGDASQDLIDDMLADPAALRRTLAKRLHRQTDRFLLVVDQFEELFTYGQDHGAGGTPRLERQAYIDNLLVACGMPVAALAPDGEAAPEPVPAAVILTLRAEDYDACAAYDSLPSALASHQQYVTAMTRDELLRTVVLPAQAGDWVFEQGLVEQILEDAGDEPGVLPLLSHALYQTWNNRSGRAMTLKGYRQAGGVQKAIATTAEAVYKDKLVQEGTRDERELARRIFLALVDPAEEGRATRRRAARDTFDPQGDGQTPKMAVLRKLSNPAARLVTMDQKWVQLAHEALIREWSRLGDWLRQYRSELELWDGIRDAAAAWAEAKDDKKRSELLVHKGGCLDDAVKLRDQAEYSLTAQERDYVVACAALRDREQREKEEQQRRELEAAHKLAAEQAASARRMRHRAIVIATVGVAAIVLVILSTIFWRQAQDNARQASDNAGTATANLALAVTNEAAANAASTRAVGNAATATANLAMAITNEAEANTQRAFALTSEAAANVSSARALASAATAQANADIARAGELAALSTNQLDGRLDQALLLAIEAFRRENLLQTRQALFKALWHNPQLSRFLYGHFGMVGSIAWSADGRLASGSEDGTVIVWDLESGRPAQTLERHQDRVTSVAWSADGRLASGSMDRTVQVWIMDPEIWINETCQRAGRNLTKPEWRMYFPGEDYRKTCEEWPAGE